MSSRNPADVLKKEFRHWRDVREQYNKDMKDEVKENQRCAIDVIEALNDSGMEVNYDLAE